MGKGVEVGKDVRFRFGGSVVVGREERRKARNERAQRSLRLGPSLSSRVGPLGLGCFFGSPFPLVPSLHHPEKIFPLSRYERWMEKESHKNKDH